MTRERSTEPAFPWSCSGFPAVPLLPSAPQAWRGQTHMLPLFPRALPSPPLPSSVHRPPLLPDSGSHRGLTSVPGSLHSLAPPPLVPSSSLEPQLAACPLWVRAVSRGRGGGTALLSTPGGADAQVSLSLFLTSSLAVLGALFLPEMERRNALPPSLPFLQLQVILGLRV